mmetsp:Transcript_54123/g.88327  ORF Transcript_54123/g.88327 Transcript_54123/m.88327 type:complete len:356 (-) Transcript_54123:315-1382(-)
MTRSHVHVLLLDFTNNALQCAIDGLDVVDIQRVGCIAVVGILPSVASCGGALQAALPLAPGTQLLLGSLRLVVPAAIHRHGRNEPGVTGGCPTRCFEPLGQTLHPAPNAHELLGLAPLRAFVQRCRLGHLLSSNGPGRWSVFPGAFRELPSCDRLRFLPVCLQQIPLAHQFLGMGSLRCGQRTSIWRSGSARLQPAQRTHQPLGLSRLLCTRKGSTILLIFLQQSPVAHQLLGLGRFSFVIFTAVDGGGRKRASIGRSGATRCLKALGEFLQQSPVAHQLLGLGRFSFVIFTAVDGGGRKRASIGRSGATCCLKALGQFLYKAPCAHQLLCFGCLSFVILGASVVVGFRSPFCDS